MSQRIADAVDAYEEFLTVKWVLDAIDGCELHLNRHRKTFYDRPYFVLPDYPEIRTALWFIEAIPDCEVVAHAALREATEHYEAALTKATQGGLTWPPWSPAAGCLVPAH